MNLAILLFLISTFIFAMHTTYLKEEKDNWTGAFLYYISIIVIACLSIGGMI